MMNGVWEYVVSFFFFQAEDGIRDVAVTGVQTCALPISPLVERVRPVVDLRLGADDEGVGRLAAGEIGRASCRERVEISGVGVSLKKKLSRNSLANAIDMVAAT